MKKFSVLTPPDFELQFRAIGMVKGAIKVFSENQGILMVDEVREFSINIGGVLRSKVFRTPELMTE